MKFIILALLFVFAVFGQEPSKPIWPEAYSASIEINRAGSQIPELWRQFSDSTKKSDRFDGLVDFRGEVSFASIFLLHELGLQYNVFYQKYEVLCLYHPINTTYPQPNFSQWSYGGKALVQYQVANQWFFRDEQSKEFLEYYDNAEDSTPLRFNFEFNNNGNKTVEQWIYHEFDAAPQNKKLFEIPALIKPNCNRAGESDRITLSRYI